MVTTLKIDKMQFNSSVFRIMRHSHQSKYNVVKYLSFAFFIFLI